MEVEEVFEKMFIYYEFVVKIFICNIIVQVVERYLFQGMYGIFNLVEVLGLSNEIVEVIVVENKEIRDWRQILKVQKKVIEEVKDICVSFVMCKEFRVYVEDVFEDGELMFDDEVFKLVC